ncbi:MAG: hypothetical protein QOF30_360 [Acidimicrobiaceae bacterium]|nr:hypothetical protein [Acidimicrobiaceae bacterium]
MASNAGDRRVSVVVNTYNRADSLKLTLTGLSQLDYAAFEIVVVNGPSEDHTEAVLDSYAGRVKTARCPELNLSMSRNIGIALAAGDIVAFIDDDAYPDPAWLDRLVEVYADDDVAGAGGPVYDHTGTTLQTRYLQSDRIGRTTLTFDNNPTGWLNMPAGATFSSLLGTNSSFRRNRLIDIGGFDEEFEYYLDETDVCARMVDAGYVIGQLDDGFVYHKFLANHVRGENRIVRDRYVVMKNASYFALKNAAGASSFYSACVGLAEFVDAQRHDFARDIDLGLLTQKDLDKFEVDMPAAFDAGLDHFLAGPPKTRAKSWFDGRQEPWLPFPTPRRKEDRLHVCLFSQDYPPRPIGGIGRHVHALATGLAAAGHVVRVLTRGELHDRVDLDDGVWVHRVVPRRHRPPESVGAPAPLWDYAASLLDELRRIHGQRPVDVVHVPNWDAEGLAVLLDGSFRCVVGLYTPMRTLQRIDERLAGAGVADEIASCERRCYQLATALVADSDAVVTEIESAYDVRLPVERLEVIPLGVPDRRPVPPGPSRPGGKIMILFVGRLERRKGVDTLLACAPLILDRFAEAQLVLAGRDDLVGVEGATYRERFESSPEGRRLGDRVTFLGHVTDDRLSELYAECDLVVAPSRFESFGLTLLEAMVFAKPVIGGNVGGVREVVRSGENGLLVTPGDVDELGSALASLCASPELRARFGARSRQIYEAEFSLAQMVQRTNEFYDRIAHRRTAGAAAVPAAL